MIETKFKCFHKDESLKDAKVFNINDILLNPIGIDFEIALQYMGFADAENTDIYAGDVLCLTITPELMDHEKDLFFNSNIGKYVEENNITEIYMAITPPETKSLFKYYIYTAKNHKIERCEEPDDPDYRKPEILAAGEDTNFPMYLIVKGAKIVSNLYENPEFLNNL